MNDLTQTPARELSAADFWLSAHDYRYPEGEGYVLPTRSREDVEILVHNAGVSERALRRLGYELAGSALAGIESGSTWIDSEGELPPAKVDVRAWNIVRWESAPDTGTFRSRVIATADKGGR